MLRHAEVVQGHGEQQGGGVDQLIGRLRGQVHGLELFGGAVALRHVGRVHGGRPRGRRDRVNADMPRDHL